jgi:hypothetical protein
MPKPTIYDTASMGEARFSRSANGEVETFSYGNGF